MGFSEIKIPYNEHRLEALRRVIENNGDSIDEIVRIALDKVYEQKVSAEDKFEVDKRIAFDKNREVNFGDSFSIIHLNDDRSHEYFLIKDLKDFYDIAKRYCDEVKNDVDVATLDTLESDFGEYESIDKNVFEILANSMPNDNRVRTVAEFDFVNKLVSVLDSSDGAYRTYYLSDVEEAIAESELSSAASTYEKHHIFTSAMDDVEPIEDEGQTMGM